MSATQSWLGRSAAVDLCRGVSPSQAAKSRPAAKLCAAGSLHAQGATLFVLLQPSPNSARLRPSALFTAVLSVTLAGHCTKIPKDVLLVAVLPITVLADKGKNAISIPSLFPSAVLPVTVPWAKIPTPLAIL